MHKGIDSSALKIAFGLVLFTGLAIGLYHLIGAQRASAQTEKKAASPSGFDAVVRNNSERMMKEGQQTFRFDTFGSEAFWGDALQLHKAIAGEKNGGVGGGVSPKTALSVGLKVDSDALPDSLKEQLKEGKVDLDDPATTLALLKLNSVVGVKGIFDKGGHLQSMGLQCAFCHSTVDDSLAPGIGKRLDGWANRDLNVGAIVSLAPNLKPFTDLLGVDAVTVKKVLNSWGPGCFDAELDKDGKAFRPDGKRACTLIPPAFGLAGVNLHTWTGFGSVTYWNAYVAATEMHGSGTFFDARLNKQSNILSRRRVALAILGESQTWSRRSWQLFTSISSPSRRRSPRKVVLTERHLRAEKQSSMAKRTALAATFRRFLLSRETIYMLPVRSAWIRGRPTDHRRTCTGPRPSQVCGAIRRAASIMTAALRLCPMWSSTTMSFSNCD